MSEQDTNPVASARNWATIVLATVAVIGAIVLARNFLMPVFLAFLLALTVSPIRRGLQRHGVPAPLTAAALVIALVAGVTVLFTALAEPIRTYSEDSRQIAADVERKLRGISETIEKVAEASDQVEKLAEGEEDPGVEQVEIKEPGMFSRMAASAPLVAGQAVFSVVLLYFLIASGDMFYAKIVEASPTFRDKRKAIGIVRDIERRISRYFLTISAINAALGVAVGLVLWWIGMPNPLLFGVMACLLNFIPYLGSIVGIAITFAIGVVSFDTVGQAFLAAASYFAITALEGQFVTPWAVGKRLSANPVVVFIAVAFWGWAWSAIGMFIAVPLLIVIMVIAENVRGMEGVAIFLSGDRTDQGDTPENQAKAA